MENIIAEELVRLTGKQPAEFFATLKGEDSEWKSEDEIRKAVKELYDGKLQTVVKDQSGRAVRERMKGVQDYIRESYGVESDGKLEDHLAKLVEKVKSDAPEKVVEKFKELDEAGLRKHPKFEELLKAEVTGRVSAAEQERDEAKKALNDYITAEETKKLDTALNVYANKALAGIKAKLSEDENVSARQVKMFVSYLKGAYNFRLADDGTPYPVNEKGDPLQNSSYQDISFVDVVKAENTFELHQFDPNKQGAEAQTRQPEGRNRQPRPVGKFKDENDYFTQLKSAKTPQEKAELSAAYKAQFYPEG